MSLDKWRWICKDKTGDVFVFENKPMLDIEEGVWKNSGGNYAHCWRENPQGFLTSLSEINKHVENKPRIKVGLTFIEDLEREIYECRAHNRKLEESNKVLSDGIAAQCEIENEKYKDIKEIDKPKEFLKKYQLEIVEFSQYPDFYEVEECTLKGIDRDGYFIDDDGFVWPYCRPKNGGMV